MSAIPSYACPQGWWPCRRVNQHTASHCQKPCPHCRSSLSQRRKRSSAPSRQERPSSENMTTSRSHPGRRAWGCPRRQGGAEEYRRASSASTLCKSNHVLIMHREVLTARRSSSATVRTSPPPSRPHQDAWNRPPMSPATHMRDHMWNSPGPLGAGWPAGLSKWVLGGGEWTERCRVQVGKE